MLAAPVIALGDLALTLPAGAAIAAWLLAWRAWRMAACWSVLFVLGMGLVGFGKIAFMAWGGGLALLEFKAASGHAAGVAAIYPTLFYLLLHQAGAAWRTAAMATGLALALLVAALLVFMQEHSGSEALAGWLTGAAVSTASIALSGALPAPRPVLSLLCFALVFAAVAWLMQSAHIGYWMIKSARLLSGNDSVFPLSLE
jgi:hypothetical protein